MRVSKWGNSLAVRLPTAVVGALDLKEGDQIEIRIARERVFEVSRDQSKPQRARSSTQTPTCLYLPDLFLIEKRPMPGKAFSIRMC
jgi:Growth regulator